MKSMLWMFAVVCAAQFLSACEVNEVYFDDFLNNIDINHADGDVDGDADTDWWEDSEWWGDTDWETDWDTGWEAWCGNGVLEDFAGEECDDGNWESNDGCSEMCLLEPGWMCPMPGMLCEAVCGDGVIAAGEQCDDGVNDGSYGSCAPGCVLGPYCGDGEVQADFEACDDGVNDGSYGGCMADCTLGPYCGDAIVNGSEECDDGNRRNWDGCSNRCRIR